MSSGDLSFKIESGAPNNPPLFLLRFVYWSWAGLTINFQTWWMYEEYIFRYRTIDKTSIHRKYYHYNINLMYEGKHFWIDKVI